MNVTYQLTSNWLHIHVSSKKYFEIAKDVGAALLFQSMRPPVTQDSSESFSILIICPKHSKLN